MSRIADEYGEENRIEILSTLHLVWNGSAQMSIQMSCARTFTCNWLTKGLTHEFHENRDTRQQIVADKYFIVNWKH